MNKQEGARPESWDDADFPDGLTADEDNELAAEQSTGYGDVLANDLEQLE